jgi:murein DD-endopeptidase MepM/ murein hydrolase activator NlpD
MHLRHSFSKSFISWIFLTFAITSLLFTSQVLAKSAPHRQVRFSLALRKPNATHRSLVARLQKARPQGIPTHGKFTSGFGMRRDPFTRRRTFHNGIDFAGRIGTPVFSTAPGKVVASGWAGGYGRRIAVNHGYGLMTLYGHLWRFKVRPGKWVKRGQLIGWMGNSGRSTGPHLHYAVFRKHRPVNPVRYLRRR